METGKLVKAEGKNPNSFFFTAETMTPIISENATIEELTLPKTFLYDIMTEKGRAYTFKIKK